MNYRNPDELTQKIGRAGLEYAGAIVIVPRKPLDAGVRYMARAVVDNVTYEWTFSTGTKPPQARTYTISDRGPGHDHRQAALAVQLARMNDLLEIDAALHTQLSL